MKTVLMAQDNVGHGSGHEGEVLVMWKRMKSFLGERSEPQTVKVLWIPALLISSLLMVTVSCTNGTAMTSKSPSAPVDVQDARGTYANAAESHGNEIAGKLTSHGVAQAVADPKLSDKKNLDKGHELARQGKTQKAYDLYFKEIKSKAPKYKDSLTRYIKKYNIQTESRGFGSSSVSGVAGGGSGKKWVLQALNVGLGMTAAVAVMNHNKAVHKYNTLLSEIDNTTEQNYLILRSREQDVKSKRRTATILSIGAGATLGYTLVDALFLHKFFPRTVSVDINPVSMAVAMKVGF